jgi:hypothetical protein
MGFHGDRVTTILIKLVVIVKLSVGLLEDSSSLVPCTDDDILLPNRYGEKDITFYCYHSTSMT